MHIGWRWISKRMEFEESFVRGEEERVRRAESNTLLDI